MSNIRVRDKRDGNVYNVEDEATTAYHISCAASEGRINFTCLRLPKEHAEVLPSGGDEREKAVELVRELVYELHKTCEYCEDREQCPKMGCSIYRKIKHADEYIKGGK